MTAASNYIIFQCYGYDRVFHECAFALLSLSRLYPEGLPADTEVWIYTDKPGWFRNFSDCPLPLNYREVDMDTIKKWRGKIDFVHRVKIEILKDFTKDRTGNVLYADTDVVFTRAIDKLFAGIAKGNRYMHIMEGNINEGSNRIFRKLNSHLAAKTNLKINGRPMAELAMWNAGVLGFNTQYNYLLDRVLDFTDSEYPQFPKHVVEQFAFSAFFSEPGDIMAAIPYILHYWNLKEAGTVLSSFFKYFEGRAWNELTHLSKLVQIPVLMQEKINFYQNRSIIDKIRKKQWAPAKQDWAELVKQL
jgi:hypothetical protein